MRALNEIKLPSAGTAPHMLANADAMNQYKLNQNFKELVETITSLEERLAAVEESVKEG